MHSSQPGSFWCRTEATARSRNTGLGSWTGIRIENRAGLPGCDGRWRARAERPRPAGVVGRERLGVRGVAGRGPDQAGIDPDAGRSALRRCRVERELEAQAPVGDLGETQAERRDGPLARAAEGPPPAGDPLAVGVADRDRELDGAELAALACPPRAAGIRAGFPAPPARDRRRGRRAPSAATPADRWDGRRGASRGAFARARSRNARAPRAGWRGRSFRELSRMRRSARDAGRGRPPTPRSAGPLATRRRASWPARSPAIGTPRRRCAQATARPACDAGFGSRAFGVRV